MTPNATRIIRERNATPSAASAPPIKWSHLLDTLRKLRKLIIFFIENLFVWDYGCKFATASKEVSVCYGTSPRRGVLRSPVVFYIDYFFVNNNRILPFSYIHTSLIASGEVCSLAKIDCLIYLSDSPFVLSIIM